LAEIAIFPLLHASACWPGTSRRLPARDATYLEGGAMTHAWLPVPHTDGDETRAITGAIERVLSELPAPRTHSVPDATTVAAQVARAAARKAAVLSGSLALPPGPLGMLTVLPDLFLIWKVQRQMVADIFALHGRTAELTRNHMLYCLFRHLASQVARDVVVRAGQRAVVQQLSGGALRNILTRLGASVSRRLAGTTATRWLPVAGAAAVGAYAYWDTMQVAKTARRLLESSDAGAATCDAAEAPG
jgi:hypothetical protein